MATIEYVTDDMTIGEERQSYDLRQGIDGAPVHTLALAVGKHAAGRLVRAAVGAVLAGIGLIRTNAPQYTLSAVGPGIALAAAHTVSHHLLVGDILLVSGSAA